MEMDIPSINIVSHAYAEAHEEYATFLRLQLSSLVLNPPKNVAATITICYTKEDKRVVNVLDEFAQDHCAVMTFDGRQNPTRDIYLNLIELDPPYLWRRSIGRNAAAKSSVEDLVWFTDVDHCFQEGCLDFLWCQFVDVIGPKPVGVYPRQIQIVKDHQSGDQFVWSIAGKSGLVSIDPIMDQCIIKNYNRQIGGVQIVAGEFARRFGYLDGVRRYQRPRPDNKPFGDFNEDPNYREFVKRTGVVSAIDLPGLYRLRHSCRSYDERVVY